jgi:hypothetical protein
LLCLFDERPAAVDDAQLVMDGFCFELPGVKRDRSGMSTPTPRKSASRPLAGVLHPKRELTHLVEGSRRRVRRKTCRSPPHCLLVRGTLPKQDLQSKISKIYMHVEMM